MDAICKLLILHFSVYSLDSRYWSCGVFLLIQIQIDWGKQEASQTTFDIGLSSVDQCTCICQWQLVSGLLSTADGQCDVGYSDYGQLYIHQTKSATYSSDESVVDKLQWLDHKTHHWDTGIAVCSPHRDVQAGTSTHSDVRCIQPYTGIDRSTNR